MVLRNEMRVGLVAKGYREKINFRVSTMRRIRKSDKIMRTIGNCTEADTNALEYFIYFNSIKIIKIMTKILK